MIREMKYIGHEGNTIEIDISAHGYYKISDSVINKALMIAMNYLIENMETDKQEESE